MILLKRSKILLSIFTQRAHRYYFGKSSNDGNKNSSQQNPNYISSKKVVKSTNKQALSIKQSGAKLDDYSSLKLLLLGNCALLGLLPFYPALNGGICVLNATFIMSRLGLEIKNYLLQDRNNSIEGKSQYRSFYQYNKLIVRNSLILLLQAITISQAYSYESILITMAWMAYAYKVQIIPISFLLNLIPLILSLLVVHFGKDIKSFILQQNIQKPSEKSTQQAK